MEKDRSRLDECPFLLAACPGELEEDLCPSAKVLFLSAKDRGEEKKVLVLVAGRLGGVEKVLGGKERVLGGVEKDRCRLDAGPFRSAKVLFKSVKVRFLSAKVLFTSAKVRFLSAKVLFPSTQDLFLSAKVLFP